MLETTAKIGIHATDNPLVAIIGKVLPISKGGADRVLVLEKQRLTLSTDYFTVEGMKQQAEVTIEIDFKNERFDILRSDGDFKPEEKFYFNNIQPVSDRASRLEAVSSLVTEAIRVGSRIMEFYYQQKVKSHEA